MKEPLLEMCFRHEQFVWHFFLDNQNRLCCKKSPKEEKQWSDPILLQDSYGGQFVVALRSGEQIHIAATDQENTIWYHRHLEGNWNRSAVTKIHPLIEINDLSLTVDSLGQTHLLYCIRTGRKNGEWQITHSYWADRAWHSALLDSGIGLAEAKSSVLVDKYNNLHLIYAAPGLHSSVLRHQTFDRSSGEWRNQEDVPLLHHENQQPCAVFDKDGNLHLVWICSDGRNFRVAYNRLKNRPWPEGGWEDPRYISDKGVNAYSPYLMITGDTLTSLWQQLNGVFHRSSEDMGQTWEDTKKQNTFPNLHEYALNFFTPSNREIDHLNAFSSSGAQITLTTAASLLASPVTFKEAQDLIDISDKNLSSTVKKFLLEYSDTRLTNRLMDETIDNQKKHLELLEQENKDLLIRLDEQYRQIKSFKALSELHRKESLAMKQTIQNLTESVVELKATIDILREKNLELETQLKASAQREAETQEKLQQLVDENTFLAAQTQKLEQELEKLESASAGTSSQEGATPEEEEKKEAPPIVYRMVTWHDFQ